jgi:hypothetical protein
VKVLFDQNVPRNLRIHLTGHEVLTAANMDWQELENGDLLKAAEFGGFDVFITCDQSLRYQQNLIDRKIAIIELTKNNWPSIQPYVAQIKRTVDASTEGEYHTIECAYLFSPRKR